MTEYRIYWACHTRDYFKKDSRTGVYLMSHGVTEIVNGFESVEDTGSAGGSFLGETNGHGSDMTVWFEAPSVDVAATVARDVEHWLKTEFDPTIRVSLERSEAEADA